MKKALITAIVVVALTLGGALYLDQVEIAGVLAGGLVGALPKIIEVIGR